MVVEATPKPALSVYELVLLFDDHPTAPLIHAICNQVWPYSNRVLLHAMYGVPMSGALPDAFAYRLTDDQERLIDLGYEQWKISHGNPTPKAPWL